MLKQPGGLLRRAGSYERMNHNWVNCKDAYVCAAYFKTRLKTLKRMPTCSEACRMIIFVDKNVQRLESEDNQPIISPRAPKTNKTIGYDIV